MKRYRGENSLYDDIAARFDKHLAEPEPPKYKRWGRVSLATWKAWHTWRCWFEQEASEVLQLWPNMACELQRSDETRLDNWSMLAMALSRNAPLILTKEILHRTVPSVFVQVVHVILAVFSHRRVNMRILIEFSPNSQ